MLFRTTALVAFALSAACAGEAESSAAEQANSQAAAAWRIGPVIRGRNYSDTVAVHASPRGAGWYFDLPRSGRGVHYVTFRHGSLAGKRRIVMRYRIEAAPGVRIVPTTAPQLPSIITLYFQRGGDDWSGRGRFESYRWYATFASQSPITPGDHVLVAPLTGNWTAVERSSAASNPAAFRDAIAEADQVGFVLGGGDGYGHGVYATGPARLIVTEFRVE
jgi:hypothetical protein